MKRSHRKCGPDSKSQAGGLIGAGRHDQKRTVPSPGYLLQAHFFSFLFLTMTIALAILKPGVSLSASEEEAAVRKLSEEYTTDEKTRYTAELLALGDQLFENKNYEYAMAAYEQVFFFDPENAKASAKIDLLKKQIAREGKDETGVVKAVYDEEAKERVREYWVQAQEYLKSEKYGQARFALEKILLLDPMNQEAGKIYEELKSKLDEASRVQKTESI